MAVGAAATADAVTVVVDAVAIADAAPVADGPEWPDVLAAVDAPGLDDVLGVVVAPIHRVQAIAAGAAACQTAAVTQEKAVVHDAAAVAAALPNNDIGALVVVDALACMTDYNAAPLLIAIVVAEALGCVAVDMLVDGNGPADRLAAVARRIEGLVVHTLASWTAHTATVAPIPRPAPKDIPVPVPVPVAVMVALQATGSQLAHAHVLAPVPAASSYRDCAPG